MLDEFWNLISGYPNFCIELEIDKKKTVYGLKLEKYKVYPWKNKREEKAYADEYLHLESEISIRESIKWLNIQCYERIHILYSWAYVLRISSLLIYFASLINILLQNKIAALVYIAFALIMYFTNILLERKARNVILSRSFTESFLLMLIEKQKKENSEED